MKKLLAATLLSFSAFANTGLSVDSIKIELEDTGIRAMDWYKKGDTYFADSQTKRRKIEASLKENKAFLEIKYDNKSPFIDNDTYYMMWGLVGCKRIALMIPHVKTEILSWDGPNVEASPEEKKISAIFSHDLPINKGNESELNGWKFKIHRGFDTVSCSVIKI